MADYFKDALLPPDVQPWQRVVLEDIATRPTGERRVVMRPQRAGKSRLTDLLIAHGGFRALATDPKTGRPLVIGKP